MNVPPNAWLTYAGDDFRCRRGFSRVGQSCVLVAIPAHATLNYRGDDWVCEFGYKAESGQCVPMTAEEIRQARRASAGSKSRSSRWQGDCLSRSAWGGELCLSVADVQLSCRRSSDDRSWEACAAAVEFSLDPGQVEDTSLRVAITCDVVAELSDNSYRGFSQRRARGETSARLADPKTWAATLDLPLEIPADAAVRGIQLNSASCRLTPAG